MVLIKRLSSMLEAAPIINQKNISLLIVISLVTLPGLENIFSINIYVKHKNTIPSIDYECKECGKIFKIAPFQLRTSRYKVKKHYCSKICQNKSQIKSVNVICKNCNICFVKRLAQIKKSKK
jgi:predicted nucleic acid-binding Zn ribbon protein